MLTNINKYTLVKLSLSVDMKDVLVEREVELEDGRETAALTAVAIVWKREK